MTTRKRIVEPKSHTVQVRVTASQYQALCAAAQREGFDLAPWLRAKVLRLAEKGGTS